MSQRLGIEPLRVRFEDVVGSTSPRSDVAVRLASVLGVNHRAVGAALLAELPVVMATTTPSPARWRRRRDGLRSLINDPRVAAPARAELRPGPVRLCLMFHPVDRSKSRV